MALAQDILLGAQAGAVLLPACDHYSGVEARMRKSLALQAEMQAEFGACVFDVTLDCEDGAPVGGEAEHAHMVAELANAAAAASGGKARVAVRVHPVDHPHFGQDISIIVGKAGGALCHIMLPKVESPQDVDLAKKAVMSACEWNSTADCPIPLQVLIESPAAVHRAFDIAAHPAVQSLSFGLMDFVSAHGGAIPAQAMSSEGQFSHPLVVRAKLEIASACHAHGKVPAHGVVTEFADAARMQAAATKASRELGYTRMWSIHPSQIRPILAAFAPSDADIDSACAILDAAQAAQWAPISHGGVLHDRASYRYYWQVIQRAQRTGHALDARITRFFN